MRSRCLRPGFQNPENLAGVDFRAPGVPGRLKKLHTGIKLGGRGLGPGVDAEEVAAAEARCGEEPFAGALQRGPLTQEFHLGSSSADYPLHFGLSKRCSVPFPTKSQKKRSNQSIARFSKHETAQTQPWTGALDRGRGASVLMPAKPVAAV